MMRRALVASALLVLCSSVFGATVFREQVAQAAQAVLQVKIMNTAAEPVPVRQQGTSTVEIAGGPLQVSDGSDVVQKSKFLFFAPDETSVEGTIILPEGKRLLVRYVNVHDDFAPQLISVGISAQNQYFFPAIVYGPNSREWVSEQVSVSLEGTIQISLRRNVASGGGASQAVVVSLFGTLQDAG
jgi:hypothetical protein